MLFNFISKIVKEANEIQISFLYIFNFIIKYKCNKIVGLKNEKENEYIFY